MPELQVPAHPDCQLDGPCTTARGQIRGRDRVLGTHRLGLVRGLRRPVRRLTWADSYQESGEIALSNCSSVSIPVSAWNMADVARPARLFQDRATQPRRECWVFEEDPPQPSGSPG